MKCVHRAIVAILAFGFAACIPDDPQARGGIAVHVRPSETTRGKTFRTDDGWDVTIESVDLGLEASLVFCEGDDPLIEVPGRSYGRGTAYFDASELQRIDIRAVRSGVPCALRVGVQQVFGSVDRGYACRVRGVAVLRRSASGVERRRTFDLRLKGPGRFLFGPSLQVKVPAGDKLDVSVDFDVEGLFRDAMGPQGTTSFWDVAATDGNNDDIITSDEFDRSFLELWSTFRSRLFSNVLTLSEGAPENVASP